MGPLIMPVEVSLFNMSVQQPPGRTGLLVVERDGPVAVVSFNRPGSLNAIEAGIRREIAAAVDEVNADDSIRVVILTGEGRAFCAGADLTEKPAPGFDVETMLNTEYKPVLMAITEAPKPWISAVNGAAAGVGSAFAAIEAAPPDWTKKVPNSTTAPNRCSAPVVSKPPSAQAIPCAQPM